MNERIKELYKQAVDHAYEGVNPNNGWKNGKDFAENVNEKFAELIVRECVSIVSKRKNQAIDDEWNVDEAMSMAEMDLEKHFGVE